MELHCRDGSWLDFLATFGRLPGNHTPRTSPRLSRSASTQPGACPLDDNKEKQIAYGVLLRQFGTRGDQVSAKQL